MTDQVFADGSPIFLNPSKGNWDYGTPELQAKKQAAGIHRNDALDPLTLLLSRKVIDQDQYDACRAFMELRRSVLGPGLTPQAINILKQTAAWGGDDEIYEAQNASYRACLMAISKAGFWERYEVEHVLYDEQLPTWMSPGQDNAGRSRFMRGIKAVENWWHHEREARIIRRRAEDAEMQTAGEVAA